MKLRKYQQEAVNAIFKEWNDKDRVLLVQATGTGKTIVFSNVAKQISDNGGRVLILAHRDELISQAQEKIYQAQKITVGIEKAQSRSNGESVIVGSVQTLGNRKRLDSFPNDYFTHIVIDEAHHATASQYQAILQRFSKAKVLGVTATPYRGDKEDLSEIFDGIAYEYSLIQAIKEGFLSPITVKQIPVKLDLTSVHSSYGDYKANELGDALEPYLEEIATIMAEECRNRKTVVFLPLISTSQEFAELLRERGLNAVEINGNSPNRKEVLQEFNNGGIDVLCNSMLLTEGWDCPSVDCIVNLRPTRSETLHTQIIGRGTRICEGKEDLLVLDFLWLTDKYDICRTSSLIAKSKDVETIIDELIESGKEVDLVEAGEEAEEEVKRRVKAEREKSLKDRIAENSQRKGKTINPVDFALSIDSEELLDYQPQFAWEEQPPTEKQVEVLQNNGLDVSVVKSRGFASMLISHLMHRRELDLATPKQIRLLERYSFKNVSQWKKSDASSMIGRIAGNNWKVPQGVNPRTYSPEGRFIW